MTLRLHTAAGTLTLGEGRPHDAPACQRCGAGDGRVELDVPPTLRGHGLPRVLIGPGARRRYCPPCVEELVALGTAIDPRPTPEPRRTTV